MSERILVKVGDTVVKDGLIGTVKRIALHPKYPDDQDWSRFEVEVSGLFGKRRTWISAFDIHLLVQP